MKKLATIAIVVVVAICGIGMYLMKGFTAGPPKKSEAAVTVLKKDLDVQVVETGTVNAQKVVEVKSRVQGRLKKLFVEEGDTVKAGQLIAIIDPRETQLLVDQNQAQVRGARSAVAKANVDISQRRLTAQADLSAARLRVAQARHQAMAQPKLTDAAVQQAQTTLATAIAERRRIMESAQPSQRITAQSSIDEAKANLANAQQTYNRDAELLAKGYVSQQLVDNDKLTFDLAKVRLTTAEDNFAKIIAGFKADIAKADQAILQAKAGLNSAQANRMVDGVKKDDYLAAVESEAKARAALRDVESMSRGRDQSQANADQLASVLQDAQRNLGETEIRAPIDGIVTKKEIQEGELVSSLSSFSSGTAIVRLEDRRNMRVQLNVNEIDVARMKLGMDATVSVDALPSHDFKGTVTKIAPSSIAMDTAASATAAAPSSDSVVKYQVEIRIADPNQELRSGMSAKCSLNVVHLPNVLSVPLEYVGHDGDKAFLMVLPAGDQPKGQAPKALRKDVKLGTSTSTSSEIISGAREGDVLERPAFTGPARKGAMEMGGG